MENPAIILISLFLIAKNAIVVGKFAKPLSNFKS
jgi:hypothetical protein